MLPRADTRVGLLATFDSHSAIEIQYLPELANKACGLEIFNQISTGRDLKPSISSLTVQHAKLSLTTKLSLNTYMLIIFIILTISRIDVTCTCEVGRVTYYKILQDPDRFSDIFFMHATRVLTVKIN